MALAFAAIVTLGFFIAGLFDVLNFFIVKVVLILSFVFLLGLAINYAVKNETKENRPEDELQDDLH